MVIASCGGRGASGVAGSILGTFLWAWVDGCGMPDAVSDVWEDEAKVGEIIGVIVGGCSGLVTLPSRDDSGSVYILAKPGPADLGDCSGEGKYDSGSVDGDRGDSAGSIVGGRMDSGEDNGLELLQDVLVLLEWLLLMLLPLVQLMVLLPLLVLLPLSSALLGSDVGGFPCHRP